MLLDKEEAVINDIRKSEDEVRKILDERTMENSRSERTYSVYDTERNDKAKKYKDDLVCILFIYFRMKQKKFVLTKK